MSFRSTVLGALALASIAAPAFAADPDARTARPEERSRISLPLPGIPAVPVDHALQTLQRLGLHPGQDALDPRETARQRPERPE